MIADLLLALTVWIAVGLVVAILFGHHVRTADEREGLR